MSPLRVGPSRCLGQGETWGQVMLGQVMLRPDAPHGKRHQMAAGEVGEGPFSEPPPATSHLCDSSRSSSIYQEALGRQQPSSGVARACSYSLCCLRLGLRHPHLAFWGSQWGKVVCPPLGPNLLGYWLILVGTLVVSKNIRDSWQGRRQNEN